ncbi:MAG TPA: FKBP-type peptidyl-prolyl cis-trans isomerase, partial [Pseudomonadales bacterium]|nr:FKBP-type peptidyl-prolyl cis-trans isomerase [Pseudomonadales bacterium]
MINFNSKVTLHFAVLLDGQEIDSTFERQPACFVMGDGSLLPGFEKRLLGLKRNDQREFEIPASEGFGERQQANIQRVRRSEFGSELPLQAGLLIGFVQPGGQEVP